MTLPQARRPARLGILGGMGPAATADFYAKLVQATPARRDQDHIPVLMEADPGIPDRSESFLRGGPSPLPWLREGAASLQARGAQLIAMPCNTAHLWHEEIAGGLQVPLLHIVDAVVEDLVALLRQPSQAPLRIGLLCTQATREGRLYALRAAAHPVAGRWQWLLPEAGLQRDAVDAGIAAVKGGDIERGGSLMSAALQDLLAQGAHAVVHACTEVPLALAGVACPVPASDSTAALARLAARHAMGLSSRPAGRPPLP